MKNADFQVTPVESHSYAAGLGIILGGSLLTFVAGVSSGVAKSTPTSVKAQPGQGLYSGLVISHLPPEFGRPDIVSDAQPVLNTVARR